MVAKWIWKYREFEFYNAQKYLLAREERGNKIPAFYEIPHCSKSVRFFKKVILEKPENVRVISDGDAYISVDGTRINGNGLFVISKGEHRLTVVVGNSVGMCALYVEGETFVSDESWIADSYDGVWEAVGTSKFCVDKKIPPSEYKFPERAVPIIEDRINGNERVVDFGKNTFVRVELKNVDSETKIFYGESLDETYSDRCVIVDGVSACDFTSLPERACQFIRFVGSVSFDIKVFNPYNPVEDLSCFECDNKLLNDIYDISKYTLSLCSRMFWLDGIKRDRWPWAGDAYITAKMDAYSFFDTDIAKRTLIAMRGNMEVNMPVNNILEYSFYWFLTMRDYYYNTGDKDFIKKNYSYAKRLIEYYIAKTDKYGFIPPISGVWLFIDWHDMDKAGDVCCVQMLYGKALECMAEFSEMCGEHSDCEYYTSIYNKLAERINEYYWNGEAYVSVIKDGIPSSQIRRHQNYFAILFGYANEAKTKSIIDNVLFNDEIPYITTPFFKFFEYDVLLKCGYFKEAFEGINKYWGGIVAQGASTVWEEFDPNMNGTEHYAMYGEPFDKSLCHAWGAGPLYFIGRYLVELVPTDVGFKSFQLEPRLDFGNYKATLPIMNGYVSVEVDDGVVSVITDSEGGILKAKGKLIELKKNEKVII